MELIKAAEGDFNDKKNSDCLALKLCFRPDRCLFSLLSLLATKTLTI